MPRLVFLLPALLVVAAPASADDRVSFRTEIMAVLSRAGCNSGPCHGNLNGKGGFKLSLRGQDPDFDYAALTRDTLGRRINPQKPADSLLLAKALMLIPHEGGQRFAHTSLESQLLRRWITQGAPLDGHDTPTPVRLEVTPSNAILHGSDKVPLRATAVYADGRRRDITSLACFEPSNLSVSVDARGVVHRQSFGESAVLVRYLDKQAVARLAFVPERKNFVWKAPPEHNVIDTHVFARLQRLRVQPSELCSDNEFIRRAYLDAIGVLPTPAETRRFLADQQPHKRSRLIDALLQRNEFADLWALRWSDLLRNEEKALDAKGVRLFHAWLRRSFIDNKPLNELARDLVAGRGSTYSHPAANYYRALRDPHTRAEATAQVFLGIRLQCAKCHNHPFDRWTQTDYHRFSAFFSRVQYRILENNRKDKLDKHEFDGEQVVYLSRTGELKHPVSGEPLQPRFLGADTPDSRDALHTLADWVAQPDNPFFARAQANRIWQHVVGKGIVDPGDDFRDSNPPINPELLDALAGELTRSKFDLRHMVRLIMNSRTYQLSAVPTATNRDDENNFARAIIRPLQAEQLLDAIGQVLGTRPRFSNHPRGTRALQLPGAGVPRRGQSTDDGQRFLAAFGKPVRSLSCECERSDDSTLAQAFHLITGPVLNGLLSEPDNRLGKMLDARLSDDRMLDELYLAALCRPPSAAERGLAKSMLAESKERRAALEDIVWSVLNAKEFQLRR